MKKQTAVIIVGLFILVVAGSCVYLYRYYNSSTKVVEEVVSAFDSNNIDESIKILEKKSTKSSDEKLLLAISYAQKGTIDFDEEGNATKALDLVNEVLLVDENNAEAYRIRGYAYEIQKKYDLAIQAYDKSILLDPQFALAYSSRGHAYDLTGMQDKAILDYKTALDLDNSLDHANLNIARFYFRNNNTDLAIEHLNKVIEESSNSSFKAAAEQILGTISLSRGDYSGAKKYFDAAIGYDSKLTGAYVGRGEAVFAQYFEDLKTNPELRPEQVYDQVFSDINSALAINKNQTSALVLAGKLLLASGDIDAAKQMLMMAEEAVPNDITLGQIEKTAYLSHITSLKASAK